MNKIENHFLLLENLLHSVSSLTQTENSITTQVPKELFRIAEMTNFLLRSDKNDFFVYNGIDTRFYSVEERNRAHINILK